MNATVLKHYRRFRANPCWLIKGQNAKLALDSARTLVAFERSEAEGMVRLRAEIDDDCVSWMDDRQRKDWDGEAYGSIGEYRLPECPCCHSRPSWVHCDSVWGHIGYKDVLDPFENPYIVDIMRSTLDALETALHDRAEPVTA